MYKLAVFIAVVFTIITFSLFASSIGMWMWCMWNNLDKINYNKASALFLGGGGSLLLTIFLWFVVSEIDSHPSN